MPDSTQAQTSTTKKVKVLRTQAEAVALVPDDISPKDCFITYDRNVGWKPITGTGCAHWVAHELGLTGSVGCKDGYLLRVVDVVAQYTQIEWNQAAVGDLWEAKGSWSHVGIIQQVERQELAGPPAPGTENDPPPTIVKRVLVRADSSATGGGGRGVVDTWFRDGDIYR
jgi:hypothetical protein